jgi:TetR/AcrR family transcriptional regulator
VPRAAAPSRASILAAAATAFAADGFAGASVDAIAARAGVNKAMIYYHFRSKHGLYLEILRGIFTAIGDRTTAIAGSAAPPAEKFFAFMDALHAEAGARPYLPPIMMREIAEGAQRLDEETLRLMSRLFTSLRAILDEGARRGVFRRANPLLTYFSVMAPIIFFRAAAPIRSAMQRHAIIGELQGLDADVFLAHLKTVALRSLAPDAAGQPTAAGRRRPRTAPRTPRAGDRR